MYIAGRGSFLTDCSFSTPGLYEFFEYQTTLEEINREFRNVEIGVKKYFNFKHMSANFYT